MATTLVKVISTELDSFKRRIVKFLRLGKSDVQTSYEAMPFGIDAVPLKDMVAVYSPTSEKGKTVVLGYINKNQLALPGEIRMYSLDAGGNQKTTLYLKKNGDVVVGNLATEIIIKSNGEITIGDPLKGIVVKNNGDIEFSGSGKNLVKFQELETGFNQLKTELNALVTVFNAHVHSGVTTGTASSGVTTTAGVPSTATILTAKASKLKTS